MSTRSISRWAALFALSVLSAALYAAGAAALEGKWVVTAGEHEGQKMDVVVGGVMTVKDGTFHIHTASGKDLHGRILVRPDAQPAQLDFVHGDGTRWEAIYEIDGDTLRLNYVAAGGKDSRPTKFATSDETEASLMTLRREKP
jgi:uncharacterized protein (TIGR03067 family)